MKSDDKTKEQLLKEIYLLKAKIGELEKSEIDRTQAEEALRESEEKYRAKYDNIPLSYQSLDEDGCFIDVNPAWLRTLGYKKEEVIGKWFGDFLHPDWKPHFEKSFSEFKRRGYVHDVQFKIRHKDGHYLDISFEGSIGYTLDGKFKQTYCVFQDITERKQMEEQLKKSLKEKEILIKEIFHRVKNNLAVVSGLLNIQAANIKDKKAKAAFQETRDRIFSLSAVHSQLYHTENYSIVDYKEYIKKLVSNIFYSSQISGHVKLHLDLADITLPIDKAIPCGLLLNEIVTNALKHAFPEKRKGNLLY